jgi:hypothetical protein
MSEDRALIPADERAVDFYGDELRAYKQPAPPWLTSEIRMGTGECNYTDWQ